MKNRADRKYYIAVRYSDDREPYRNWSNFDTLCEEWPAAKAAIPEYFEFFRVNLITDDIKVEIEADMNAEHYADDPVHQLDQLVQEAVGH